MVEKDLKADREYIEKNRKQLLSEYRNKFLLVSDQTVVESFDNYNVAAEEGVRLFGVDGKFLVYQLLDKPLVNFVMEADI